MKYNILTSPRHDEAAQEIAQRLGVTDTKLRMVLIRRLDMSILENLASRWEMGQEYADGDDRIAEELGCELLTRFVPLIDTDTMQSVYDETKMMIEGGSAVDDAIRQGKERIREALLR